MRNVWVRPVLIPLGGVTASQGASNVKMTECGHVVSTQALSLPSDCVLYTGPAVGPAS